MKNKTDKRNEVLKNEIYDAITTPNASLERLNNSNSYEWKNNLDFEFFPIGTGSIYIYDILTGYFVFVDSYVENLTGYSAEEIIYSDTSLFLSQLIIEEHLYVIPDLIKKSYLFAEKYKHLSNLYFNIEYNINTKNNVCKRILGQYKILSYDEKNYPRFVKGIISDISHMKKTGIPILYAWADNRIIYMEKADSEKFGKSKNQKFSKKEVELLRLISKGLNMKEIASKLKINVSTIYSHRKNIKAKADEDLNTIIFDLKSSGFI